MDAVKFVKEQGLEELKARLANINDKHDSVNYGKTPEEVVAQFLNDQGHKFNLPVDTKAILALVK